MFWNIICVNFKQFLEIGNGTNVKWQSNHLGDSIQFKSKCRNTDIFLTFLSGPLGIQIFKTSLTKWINLRLGKACK